MNASPLHDLVHAGLVLPLDRSQAAATDGGALATYLEPASTTSGLSF